MSYWLIEKQSIFVCLRLMGCTTYHHSKTLRLVMKISLEPLLFCLDKEILRHLRNIILFFVVSAVSIWSPLRVYVIASFHMGQGLR